MLSKLELQSIKQLYPGLKLTKKKKRFFLEGKLDFDASYDDTTKRLIINPDEINSLKKNRIKDTYTIEIEFLDDFPSSLPLIREVSGRIQKLIELQRVIDKKDLHVNPNGTICLCAKAEERLRFPDRVNIISFLNQLVVPFFYSLSYYEKNNRWPWGQRSHGDAGIFEFYLEYRNIHGIDVKVIHDCLNSPPPFRLSDKAKELLRKKGKIKGHWDCICGSSSKFRNCHKVVLEGLRLMKEDIISSSIKV